MEIVSYKKCGSNLYEVNLDNGEKYKLYDEVILKYELLIDHVIDEKKLRAIKADNDLIESYYKALHYISIKMRSKLEIINYLKKAEFNDKSIDYALGRLDADGYLDEHKYIEAFVNDSLNLGNDGPYRIEKKLTLLGLNETNILEYLSTIEDNVWQERIKKIINKKLKSNKLGIPLFKKKITNDLISLGYDIKDIREVLLLQDFQDDEALFIREAEKNWALLEKKYSGSELILKFKNKMYSKGFNLEKINLFLKDKNLD